LEIVIQLGLLVIGFVMLVKGADWFVDSASTIADKFGIPQMVIGLTIVAFGTSVPEAAISISAALKGNAAVTIGNVVGSNILNVLIILGITALITPLVIQKNTMKYEIPFVIAISGLLLFLGMNDGVISLTDGLILLAILLGFLVYLYRLTKEGTESAEKIPEEIPESGRKDNNANVPKLIMVMIIGGVLIVFGSNITVDSATIIATNFGMSQRLIGLTIIAFGTSLPELITSVTAGIKGKADIAIGNIVGSNIFNILFVVGVTGVITPVEFAPNFLYDGIVAIIAATMLLLFVVKSKTLKRSGGIIMIASYLAYFIYLIQS